MNDQMEMFEPRTTSITTDELDKMVEDMAVRKSEYEALKKQSTEAYHVYEKTRAELVSTLQQAGKEKYHVDGVGTVRVSETLKVRTPQSHDQKGAFFKWLNGKWGQEGFLSYVGINYQTLQKLYNDEFKLAKEEGNASEFEIPGISSPEVEYSLRFNK